MIGVGQQDPDAEILGEVALGEAFDGGLRADRHEDGGFDGPVRGVEQAGAGAGVRAFGDHFEGDLGLKSRLWHGEEGRGKLGVGGGDRGLGVGGKWLATLLLNLDISGI